MVKTKYIPPQKTFSQIQSQWNAIQTLDPKSKLKAMRELGHDLLNSYDKSGMEIEQLSFYMKILRPITRAYSYPQKCSKLLSKITSDWLELSGNDKATIISKNKSELISDTPSFCIGDLNYFKEQHNISSQLSNTLSYRLSLLNEGKLYELGTGGDAGYYLELRLIDSLEPVLATNEMKFLCDSTETAIMHIPTGILTVAPHLSANENTYLLSTSITPGNYKMSIFFISKKNIAIFCIVLCKTDEIAKNNYQSLYSFSENY